MAIETEYELSKSAYNIICTRLGTPEIDLFATKLNSKCHSYISWKPDPESLLVDAFTVNWSQWFFYAFPPFSIIHKVIEKIIKDKAKGIVVVPIWSGQPWYPVFKNIIIGDLLVFDPNKTLLLSPFRTEHPLWRNISLGAAILSGDLLG